MTRSILGVLAAIAVTTAMDASGLSAFSALPLLPLLLVFRRLEPAPRPPMGFRLGRASGYALAALHPIVVIGILAAVTSAAGLAHPGAVDWGRVWLAAGRVALATAAVVALTEEGFFRGWLWASVERAGVVGARRLAFTSVAFALWHVSAVCLPTGFDPPARQVPVFLVNAAVMGAIWGLLRWISGSVLAASACHGLWNGAAYVLFGFGTKVGKLGVQDTSVWGPEVGVAGLALNLLFFAALFGATRGRRAAHEGGGG